MTRTLKALGATAAAAGLLAVAGCSEQEDPVGSAPETAQDDPANAQNAESPSPAPADDTAADEPADHDFTSLLEGITYKDQQISVGTPEEIAQFKEVAELTSGEFEDVSVEPPACDEAFRESSGSFDASRIAPETLTVGTAIIDDLNIVAYDSSIADDPLANAAVNLDQCSSMTVEVAGLTQTVTVEEQPFEADAEDGYSMIQTTDVGDGQPLQVYSTLAEKNGAIVSLSTSATDEASIQAVNDTRDMILERL